MEKWEGEDRRENKWHLKKEVSVADILTLVAALLAALFAYTTMDKRVTILENAEVAQVSKDMRQDGETLRLQARIDVQLDKMNDKLDRLLSNQVNNYK